MTPVLVTRGNGPLVLGLPHVGTDVPPEIAARLTPEGQVLRDTDWHVDELYRDLIPGLTTVRAAFHRYVIDANRDPAQVSLYPGQTTTGLIPQTNFDGEPIWRDGAGPAPRDIAARLDAFHAPYHAALAGELDRVRTRHGLAVLYDCHSIRSEIPWLFDGILPDMNIGTNGGATCDPRFEAAAVSVAAASARSYVLNGRFRGGWTTRHYGRPGEGLHAIQMELAQSSHLSREAPPFAYDGAKAARLRPVLAEILQELAGLALDIRGSR